MKRAVIWFACPVIFALGLSGQEKKQFLDPAEMIRIMEESKTNYVIGPFEKLKQEEIKNLAGLLFPRRCPPVTYPRVAIEGETISVKKMGTLLGFFTF